MSRTYTLAEIEAILASEGLGGHSMEEVSYQPNTGTDRRDGEFGEFSIFDSMADEVDMVEQIANEQVLARYASELEDDDPEPEEGPVTESDDPLDGWGDFLATI